MRAGRGADGRAAMVGHPVPAGAGWRGAVEAIDLLLADGGVKGGIGNVVLGGQFATALIVPWQDKLQRREDRERYARHLHMKTFDDEAAGMVVVLGDGGYGEPTPAFFLGADRLASLRASFSGCGAQLHVVEPLLTAVFNRFRKQVSNAADSVFAVAEADHLHIAFFRRGTAWTAVRSRRLSADGSDLMRVLQREVTTLPGAPAHLYLVEHTPSQARPELAGIEVTRLKLARPAAAGMAMVI